MFSTDSVWLHMRDGYRLLSPDREGRLTLSDASQTSRVLVHPQSVESYSACMGGNDSAHVLIHTQGGNLIYGVTIDGYKWRKFTLTRSEQECRLRDPIIFSQGGGVHILYLAEQNQSEALIYYQQNPAGSWNGYTLDTFGSMDWVRLLQIVAYQNDLYLYVLSGAFSKAQIRRYSLVLESGKWSEVLLAPLPLTDFQVLLHEDRLHMSWLSDGRIFADGAPLSWSNRCRIPCMSTDGNQLSCLWLEPEGPRKAVLSPSGWQPASVPELKGEPSLHIILEEGQPLRSLQPPAIRSAPLPQYAKPVAPDSPASSEKDPQLQRMATQTLMLFRQLSGRIDRLQGEMDSLRSSMASAPAPARTPSRSDDDGGESQVPAPPAAEPPSAEVSFPDPAQANPPQ